MKYYQQQKREEQTSSEYSIGLLEKALGFVKVFGLANIPNGVKNVLDYALKKGDCSRESIELAQSRYDKEYRTDLF